MKNVSAYIDIVFCVIVLPMMILLFPVERWYHNFQWYVCMVVVWLYLLYFSNRFFTVPSLFGSTRMRVAGIVAVTLSVVVTYFMSVVTLYTPKVSIHDSGITRIFPSIQQYQQAVWCLFMIVEAFSFAVGLLLQTNLQRARRRAAETERDKAEIELYKAQIKPHFMFNTLNSLYGLFLTENKNALESLEKFISMMRYMYTSSHCDRVLLADEANYIRQYVELQSLRLNEMTEVKMCVNIQSDSVLVPPMLLVTFVENCFKHGSSPIERSEIAITLTESGGELNFSTSNHIFPVKRIGEHMGIENCRRRLELLYPQRHRLEIESDEIEYNVHLYVKLL